MQYLWVLMRLSRVTKEVDELMFKYIIGKTNYNYTRFICPCCGYPTLDSYAEYDICIMCDWEDDGQNDEDVDVVKGGPNGSYSLAEARINFTKYLCMYEPDRDMRCTGGDTSEEKEIKEKLKIAYSKVGDYLNLKHYKKEYKKVLRLEKALGDITRKKADDYSNSIGKGTDVR